MALNKFMHPRNIYKKPPDFAGLAKIFPEFSSISKMDVTGKVMIEFKDPNALRMLTKCLLKNDFNLDVEIPDDRLVPTLPLRLNYVLWIEDLLTAIKRESDVQGLDIGTGACAIYPLLAAVKNKWKMMGTETDTDSLLKAQENVQRNNLQELIKLKKNTTSSIIEHVFTDEVAPTFDFCMCNPPFYSSVQELCESRSPARLPPKNAFTGSPQELITEGGELEFCRKLIKESKQYRVKVVLFTTMIGHKFNLAVLIQELKAEGITYTHTEFCQGRVTRWGLAWTYQDYDIYELVPPRDKPRKKNTATTYLLPELPNTANNINTAFEKIKQMLCSLSIKFKILDKRGNSMSLDIVANVNTWSNQRRKRRLMKRLGTEEKKAKLDVEEGTSSSNGQHENNQNAQVFDEEKRSETNADVNSNTATGLTCLNSGNPKCTQTVVHAFLKLIKKENEILLEMDFLNGIGGKEGLHQIAQYIKNNWK